ncbi:transcription factor bHLH53 [Cajanus cajan]|uniref:Transcription factor bHLH53 n=1 Tax=Cajanus cajan TaxID=3821 RepID=A0A151RNC2_CAJCA|nr:transcription factor bHLH53 [Cajanus cajan]KYP44057.1 Transcription factor bHLH53 [Cajanus cajan]
MPEEVSAPNLNHFFPYSDESFFLSNPLFNNYLDPTGDFVFPSEIYAPYDPIIPLTHRDIFPTHEDYNLLPCPKPQKYSYEAEPQELTTPSVPSTFLEGFFVPYDVCSSRQGEEQQHELFHKVPQHDTCVDLPRCEKKDKERTISPQSIAARERRRKITEKTQELGKLVPGGPKMNTAEMLHAAAKYVNYLQAQVRMLELMKSLEEEKAAPPSEILHDLVVSPFVQEKLYTEELCFVPKEIVTTLTNDEDVKSSPTIVEDLKQLIGIDIETKVKQE